MMVTIRTEASTRDRVCVAREDGHAISRRNVPHPNSAIFSSCKDHIAARMPFEPLSIKPSISFSFSNNMLASVPPLPLVLQE